MDESAAIAEIMSSEDELTQEAEVMSFTEENDFASEEAEPVDDEAESED